MSFCPKNKIEGTLKSMSQKSKWKSILTRLSYTNKSRHKPSDLKHYTLKQQKTYIYRFKGVTYFQFHCSTTFIIPTTNTTTFKPKTKYTTKATANTFKTLKQCDVVVFFGHKIFDRVIFLYISSSLLNTRAKT